jgi:hypothetical protein
MSGYWMAQRINREHITFDTHGPFKDRTAAWKQMKNQAAILAAQGIWEDDNILDAMTQDQAASTEQDAYQDGQVMWYIWDLGPWYND